MPIARATRSAALRVRLRLGQLRDQRLDAGEDVGLFVAEIVEERPERRPQEAKLVVRELEGVHEGETNAIASSPEREVSACRPFPPATGTHSRTAASSATCARAPAGSATGSEASATCGHVRATGSS